MIDRTGIEQILAQYAKHGWILRRVLLSPGYREAGMASVFQDTEVKESDLDGLWFSRSSQPGITAWELRHLSAMPFALVENITDTTVSDDADKILRDVESRMIEVIRRRQIGH